MSPYTAIVERLPSLSQVHGLIPDPDLLGAFIDEYTSGPRRTVNGETQSGGVPDTQNFFLFWLPNRLTNIAMGIEPEPTGTALDLSTDDGFGRALWLGHLCGYYFAVWLRWVLSDTDRPRRAAQLADLSTSHVYGRFVDPMVSVANRGSDDEVLAQALGSLRRPLTLPRARFAGDVTMSLLVPGGSEVGIFGFDTSWLHHILPPSRNSPPDARPFTEPVLTYDPGRLLDARFAIPEEPYLVDARQRFASANAAHGDTASRLRSAVEGGRGESSLLVHQRRWHRFATMLYARGIPGGTRYRGLGQEQYDRLITWASYSVMIPQAAAFNGLAAHATRDAELARRQTRARSIWWALVTTYAMSIGDPTYDGRSLDDAFPAFQSS